jgi:pyruvate dehydrogenase E1 component beta subunit
MTESVTYLKAILAAQAEEMRRDDRVFLIGEDLHTDLFGTCSGLTEEFGEGRVRTTPLSENGFLGAAVGAAMTGLRPVVDLTVATFMYVAMDQFVNQIAKNRYMFGGQADIPLVVRAALYYGGSNAAHHSDRPYSMFMTVPGLKIIAPSTPADVKGLLKAAIRCDDPVICFEDATVAGRRGPVGGPEDVIPLGVADIKRPGTEVTIVAVAGAVSHALAAAKTLETEHGVSAEVVDPRSLVPLDVETIVASVSRTGRLLVVDPAPLTCSAASEIAATVAEEAFDRLRGPVRRLTAPDIHIPFSPALERPLYPSAALITDRVLGMLAGAGDAGPDARARPGATAGSPTTGR